MPKKRKPEPAPIPERKLELINPVGGLPLVYSNHLQFGQSAQDLRIVFGEITDANDQRVEVTRRVQVTIDWLQAKALKEYVSAFVDLYEKKNGSIKVEFERVVNPTLPQIPRMIPDKK